VDPANPVGPCASGKSATANFSSPPHFLYAIDSMKNPIRYAVCNAIKLSHFTGVKMSHLGLVLSSFCSEILIVNLFLCAR
jgi:hypothetical protein